MSFAKSIYSSYLSQIMTIIRPKNEGWNVKQTSGIAIGCKGVYKTGPGGSPEIRKKK